MLVAACPVGAPGHTVLQLQQHSSYGAGWQGCGRAACVGGGKDWPSRDRAVLCDARCVSVW